ncbi:LysR family transcriptional regulator [Thermovenabulum sp.]|uniref:LysR family transcriptional regulator n=1 Tax=Thermovenabulum sp. TaxID=3100335 RepID=UPI003C7E9DE4
MELYALWLFHKVAQNMSFTKTSEELHISQPAISKQIKKLEEELGLKLIEKYGKNIYLSKDGQFIFEYTKKIFALIEEMESQIPKLREKMLGHINIGASNTPGIYVLPKILGEFKGKYPEVKINLHIGNTYEIQKQILIGRLDFAVIGGEISEKESVEIERLVDDFMVLVCSPTNKLALLNFVERNQLVDQDFITHEPHSNLYEIVEDIIKTDLKIPLNIGLMLGSIDAIKNAVSANLGISIMPYISVKQDIALGHLKLLNCENKVWKYSYNLVYLKNRRLPVPAKILLQMIRERTRDVVLNHI